MKENRPLPQCITQLLFRIAGEVAGVVVNKVWLVLTVKKLFNLDHKSLEVDVRSCCRCGCSCWLICAAVWDGECNESNEKWSRNFKFGNDFNKTVLQNKSVNGNN